MPRRTLSAGLVLVALATTLFAQTRDANDARPLIAVFPFSVNRVSEEDMNTVIEVFADALFESGAFSVVDAARRDALLDELDFSLSDLSNEASQLEVGNLLSAQFIATGSLSQVDDQIIVTVKIIDTETALTTNSARDSWPSLTALFDNVDTIVSDLLGTSEPPITSETPEIETDTVPAAPAGPQTTEGPSLTTWILLAGGTTTAVAGGAVLAVGVVSYNRASDAYQSGSSDLTSTEWDALWTELEEAASRRNITSGVGLGAITVGTVAAGIGLWRLLTTPESFSAGPQLEDLFVLPTSNGLVVQGRVSW